ncbi:MAG: DUF547 domain-containing protein [Alteromonadaceae bacterium]|uniref:DUF547 domain-containing protein n=2 Tax=Paraglaciecola chathamensis TaxID=368405 RepID=A0A8H9IEL2_9ALTE|nr:MULTISPECIES: DUF547 domain-containing protein [Paraglaciecola]AEE21432.1 protein of unknown function DUF547 [Glaciecola sp. 4H-3-7+YE-5]MBN24652.1 DUF547 domain-containing protein [Alteromonadaceae bacterium]GAC06394.1 hypothetical protein GAGA_3561 [Paraglaciecola agarilytica NO2]GGZ75783.1 DUF547 domain-containing protein [Paraglaciecola oceanifecundans]|tara:strand:- start:61607 stop:62485 length:879 start_codon:yes stop_codon:yes gene_type:complete
MPTPKSRVKRLIQNMLTVSGLVITLFSPVLHAAEFDHRYTNFDQLLTQVVQTSADKKQTRVNYQRLSVKSDILQRSLNAFSAVSKSQFDGWDEQQQLSFLINAYNGFTLKLIIDNWDEFKQGDADSIRDLGSLFTTPWEKKFFTLFNEKHNLDDIEHEMVRKWFKEPRIHAALVCAAVSCPPLRDEAFVASALTTQLDSQMQRFLADNSRNEIKINGQEGEASLSSIFKWYRGDFEKGQQGFHSLFDLLSTYSEALVEGDDNAQAQRNLLKSADYPITFKDYDWRLNDVANF